MTLFERTLTGLKPTETALKLYEPVANAERALAEAAIVAEGTTGDLSGTVRITSSTVTSHYVLPPILADIRREFPAIAIELVPSDSVENLLLRESDIAVRMFRPTQLELVARKLGEIPVVACAHESYLARRGTPLAPDELAEHDLIGFDRSDLIITRRESHGLRARTRRLRRPHRQPDRDVGADEGRARASASRRKGWSRKRPACGCILPMLRPPPLEVWLTTHRELFTSRRIRAIYDRLAEGLLSYLGRRGQPGERHLDGNRSSTSSSSSRSAPWR